MNEGKVLQLGSPEEIYERPNTRFVANFIGETNFLEGTAEDIIGEDIVVSLKGQATVKVHSNVPVKIGQEVSVVIRPEKICLEEKGLVRGRVEESIYIGTDTRFIIRLNDNTSVTVREQNLVRDQADVYQKGDEVGLNWDPTHALVLTE
jgi:spermidine/putrescine transport system ATP-binding protein